MYEEGMKVIIINDTCSHRFPLGTVVTLGKPYHKDNGTPVSYFVRGKNVYINLADFQLYLED